MIFVSIAAYCDSLLGFTIERALATARRPDEVRFGIVDQSDGSCAKAVPRKSGYVRIDPEYARGPCWARAIAMSLYSGEDWFLQLDSHMDFDDGWDEQLPAAAVGLVSAFPAPLVLTTYPPAFVFENGAPVKRSNDQVLAMAVKRGVMFEGNHCVLSFEAYQAGALPVNGFHVGAGCLFAPGRIVTEVPYDPAIYFLGEEQSFALRLFTNGWNIFHVRMPIYHLYTDAANGSPPRALHWERDESWRDLDLRSRRRLNALVSGALRGTYGLGKARTVDDFARFSGIDYGRRRIAPRAYTPQGKTIIKTPRFQVG